MNISTYGNSPFALGLMSYDVIMTLDTSSSSTFILLRCISLYKISVAPYLDDNNDYS